jgi:hypothetical protein
VAREVYLLAYAIDALLELPTDAVGWRLRLRAVDTRAAIPEVAVLEEPWRRRIAEPEPGVPEPVLPPPAPVLPPPHPISDRAPDRVPTSELSRARQMTHGISNGHARELAIRAVLAGYQFRRSSGGHYVLEQGRKRITLSGSAADRGRSWANTKAHAKRLGIDVEGL